MKEKISKMLSLLTATALAVGTLTLSACGRDPVVEDSNSSPLHLIRHHRLQKMILLLMLLQEIREKTVNVITTSDR